MAYTGHGHHIQGTSLVGTPPKQVSRCGGPGVCKECTQDSIRVLGKLVRMHQVDIEKELSYPDQARQVVYWYVNEKLEKTDAHVTFGRDEVYIVWFAKTLQNWKALLSTTLPDGMYYEVTFNGDTKEAYLDAYKKFENVNVKYSQED